MNVKSVVVSLELGTVVGTVQVNTDGLDVDDDDNHLRLAATAWKAIAAGGNFTIDESTYSAAECKEWWA